MYCFSGVVVGVGGAGINFLRVFRQTFVIFLRTHETWVMHTSGRVKLKAIVNNEP